MPESGRHRRALRRTTTVALASLCAVLLLTACGGPDDTEDALHVGRIEGIVNNVMARYVDRVITHAEETNARAVLFQIDTPGGEIGAMKTIAGHIESAEIPVITWVGPPGAAAASAGTFITMAGHIAAMAPNTTIGAATPVTATGEDVPDALGRKVTEDTVAFARGLAEHHGRNADWAESAVRDAASATPSQAVELNVVDLMASTISALLEAVEGQSVVLLDGRTTVLEVENAVRVSNSPNLYERVLSIISDPMIVSLLFLFALIGIGIEFFSPGLFFPGGVGLVALILAFLGLGTLVPGEAAIALFVLALILITAEFFLPSGVLGVIGALALLMALGIWAGQISTTVDFGRVVLATLAVIVVLLVPITIWLLRYIGGTEESGTRLT